jgi:hypothetical protein
MPMFAPASAAPKMQGTALSVVINEIGWGGTQANANHEWIELYNPGPADIPLSSWTLLSTTDGTPSIPLSGTIVAGGYYLLERNDTAISDITADLTYNGTLSNTGEILELRDNTNTLIDSANLNGGGWPGGSGSPNFASMERISIGVDDDTNWGSNDGITVNGLDANGNALRASPKQQNSIYALPTSTPTITNTPTDTGTPTNTGTPTSTATPTITGTLPTATNTSSPAAGIVISEFRAIGATGGNDEFIELYNRTSSPITIGGWVINKSTGCGTNTSLIATIPSGVTLGVGKHYLIGGSSYSGSVTPDLTGQTLGIANDGGIALLNGTTIVDQVGLCNSTLYREGAALSQLFTNLANRSYDRKASSGGICVDTNNNAADFFLRSSSDPQNSNSSLTICGNPTPIPSSTPRPTPTRTLSPPPPPPLVAINEFVPRPGQDWNNDGVVNVGDEYVELINHGIIPVSLSGYSLDDEVNIGSNPYRLPALTISPGERIVFYGSETALLLSDGGDGVRLLRPNGQLADAYNYRVVRFPDQSFCRLPDNGGLDDWNTNCFPTPGLQNALSGSFVSPPNVVDADLLCPIADTLPLDFILAECPPFGNNIWSAAYWDDEGWYGEKYLPRSPGKWPVFAD